MQPEKWQNRSLADASLRLIAKLINSLSRTLFAIFFFVSFIHLAVDATAEIKNHSENVENEAATVKGRKGKQKLNRNKSCLYMVKLTTYVKPIIKLITNKRV